MADDIVVEFWCDSGLPAPDGAAADPVHAFVPALTDLYPERCRRLPVRDWRYLTRLLAADCDSYYDEAAETEQTCYTFEPAAMAALAPLLGDPYLAKDDAGAG